VHLQESPLIELSPFSSWSFAQTGFR
jgi:hypothetical protein